MKDPLNASHPVLDLSRSAPLYRRYACGVTGTGEHNSDQPTILENLIHKSITIFFYPSNIMIQAKYCYINMEKIRVRNFNHLITMWSLPGDNHMVM